MVRHLIKCGKWFYYHRRVPRDLAAFDSRTFVKVSLKTCDEAVATDRLAGIDRATEQYWDNLRKSGSGDGAVRYQAAISMARAHGFTYRSVDDIAAGDLGDLVRRLEAIGDDSGKRLQSPAGVGADGAGRGSLDVLAPAILGGVPRPSLTLTDALSLFWDLAADRVLDKNTDQIRRWRNPRIKAVNNFISILGADRSLADLRREDALAFRDWWMERLREENLTANSANKDIGHVSDVVSTVSDGLRLGLVSVFDGLRVRDDRATRRMAFSVEHVERVLLDPARLMSLNPEARWMIWAMADTGAGVNELSGLDPSDVHLAGTIPYIDIRKNQHRSLKTKSRARKIPLVGASLMAFRAMPGAFPIYRGRNVALSSTINKYLRENGLMPSPAHTLYSLRHTFQERLTAAEVPEMLQAELMGHRFSRPKYGGDVPLAHKCEWLERIAFKV